MGAVVRISCAVCQKQSAFRVGCGLLHADLERTAGLFEEDTADQIRSFGRQMQVPVFHFGYQLSYCVRCGCIESVPVLTFMNDSTVYAGVCSGCGGQAELLGETIEELSENMEQVQCLECQGESLKVDEIGWWD